MTKMQRVLATLKKEETDRVPFSDYTHSTVHERTLEKFAQFTLDYYHNYDPDYVKFMYDENYDTPVNYYFVNTREVWKHLEEYDPHIGAFGRQGREAITAAGGRGLILAPGCTFFEETPRENILALKQAVGV